MVQNNKVLTVSYGTFSCTLEGFEDSFGTMKVIAEYFRDLAADDRYFGAEPPQPDADMMARIAQREIARQVEARADAGGVHLRATAAEALPPQAAAHAPAPAEPAAGQPAEDVQKTVKEGDASPAHAEAEADEAAEPAKVPAEPAAAEPEAAAPVAVDAVEVEAEAEDTLIAETAEPAGVPGTAADADSIAAKLQRIRDVVARGTGETDEEYSEDEHAEAFLEDAADDISQALGETGPEAGRAAEDGSDEDDIAWTLDHLDLTGSAQNTVSSTAEDAEDDAEDSSAGSLDSSAAPEAADGSGQAEEADGDVSIATAEEQEPAAADKPARPARARIVRVKRAQLEEALASGELEEIEDEEDEDAAEDAGFDDALSAEEEAEMLRELAAVEAELRGTADDEDDLDDEPVIAIGADDEEEAAAPEPAEPQEPAATQAAPADGPAQERDVNRLMAAADEKLGTAESESSRETYSSLRAAVAAAEAERAAGGGSNGSGDDAEAYRDDLASVVRPRRPEPSAARSPRRPEPAARPAPLKLVAEQRVNAPAKAAAAGPVRPRRIASFRAEEAEYEGKGSEGGFAAYAEESGAVELHELLEAAASYMSFVEGREQFSRPQLMSKVQQLGHAEFNREDGLRSFGQLLREGKIERTHSGRFTASGDIGFQPGQRAAG
mgnify:FL=1